MDVLLVSGQDRSVAIQHVMATAESKEPLALGFGVWDLGLGVWGLGVWGLGFRGFGFKGSGV